MLAPVNLVMNMLGSSGVAAQLASPWSYSCPEMNLCDRHPSVKPRRWRDEIQMEVGKEWIRYKGFFKKKSWKEMLGHKMACVNGDVSG
jgi:hypothetical protein